jgi:hypothetical protein
MNRAHIKPEHLQKAIAAWVTDFRRPKGIRHRIRVIREM